MGDESLRQKEMLAGKRDASWRGFLLKPPRLVANKIP